MENSRLILTGQGNRALPHNLENIMSTLDRYPYLKIREDDTKRLNKDFDDTRIRFVLNVKKVINDKN